MSAVTGGRGFLNGSWPRVALAAAASAVVLAVLVLPAPRVAADVPSADDVSWCGGNCQAICINGCDSGKSYEWRDCRCHNNSYSDSYGSYCDDGYVCDFGACGRAQERACNTAGTGCSSCDTGYAYAAAKAYCIVKHASPGNHTDWMSDLKDRLKYKQFNQVVIPGTHDTGTYMMGGYAQTQASDRDVAKQLKEGIRYLDLRAGIAFGTYIIHHAHEITGPQISDVLDQVASFLDSHEGEIVLLKFSHFRGEAGGDYSRSQYEGLSEMIDSKLADHLIDHATLTPRSTINQILNSKSNGKGYAIVDFESTDSDWTGSSQYTKDGEVRYWYNMWRKSYAETTKRTEMRSTLETAVDNWQGKTRDEDQFFVLQTEATPFSSRAWTPQWLSESTNPVTQRWIMNDWSAKDLNVIQADYYHQSCLVPLAIWINSGRGGKPSGCYSFPSSNKTSWDAKVWPF